MSSCACGSGGGNSGCNSEQVSLEEMIERAQKNWSMPIQEEDATKWDFIFNDIGMGMSGGNAQALKPLASVYNKKGPKEFLNTCQNLLKNNIRGHLISWAYQFVNQDEEKFVERVAEGDSSLIDYVNKEAEFFECFSSNPKVGRAKSFKDPTNVSESLGSNDILNSGQRFSLKDKKLITEKKDDKSDLTRKNSRKRVNGISSADKMLVVSFIVCLIIAIIYPNRSHLF